MILASVSDLAFVGWRMSVADGGVGGPRLHGPGVLGWQGRDGRGARGVYEGEGGREAGFSSRAR